MREDEDAIQSTCDTLAFRIPFQYFVEKRKQFYITFIYSKKLKIKITPNLLYKNAIFSRFFLHQKQQFYKFFYKMQDADIYIT